MEVTLRQKRRPALSCEQCRRRKVKCDRHTPCRQCTKANIDPCQYIQDPRISLTMAPFEAQDTRFMVFDQALTSQPPVLEFSTISIQQSPKSSCTSNSWSPRSSNDLYEFPSLTHSDLGQSTPCTEAGLEPFSIGHSNLEDFSKTTTYGKSHWRSYLPQSPELSYVLQNHEANGPNCGFTTFSDCEKISMILEEHEKKAARPTDNLLDLIPTREVADSLVQAYLRTFQTVLGILHVPSFRRDYVHFWSNSEVPSQYFLAILVLVICIGSAFYSDERGISRTMAIRWTSAVSKTHNLTESNDTSTLDSLRLQCLLFLARQARSIETHWFAEGYLLRMAIHMGLHTNPDRNTFHNLSNLEIEHRRKLWATVLELEIQYAMDNGSLIFIDQRAYDTSLPTNLDDEISSPLEISAIPKPLDHLTHSSFQILLMKMIPIRLKILHFVNNFRSGDSIEDAMALYSEFTAILKTCNILIENYRMSSSPPTAFQTKIFDLFTKRFILLLRRSFAVPGIENPLYNYPLRLCTETALSLLSPQTFSHDDDFHNLLLRSGGPFQAVYQQSALYLCGELLQHPAFPVDLTELVRRDEITRAITNYLQLSNLRIAAGDRNIKCYVLVSCLLAQVNAIQGGIDVESYLSKTLKNSLESCRSLLSLYLQGYQDSLGGLITGFGGQLDWSL